MLLRNMAGFGLFLLNSSSECQLPTIMKLMYITGSHSSGKSRLLNAIGEYPGVVTFPRLPRNELFDEREYELLADHNVQEVKVFEKLSKRLADSFLEAKSQIEFARKQPPKVIVADRFLPDSLAYMMTCFELHWLNQNEFNELQEKFEASLLSTNNIHYRGIFLNPPFTEVQKEFDLKNLNGSRFWERQCRLLETAHRMFEYVYQDYLPNLHKDNKWLTVNSFGLNDLRSTASEEIELFMNDAG